MSVSYVSPWWQAAMMPPRWNVAGVMCGPLSVWHTYALEQLGNPYAIGGACTRADGVALLALCGCDMDAGRRIIMRTGARARSILRVNIRTATRSDDAIHAACLDYVRSCDYTARRWQKSAAGSKGAAAPYQYHIVHAMCRDYNMLTQNAWDMPYAVARCQYDAAAEARGDDSLMRDEYMRMEDEMATERQVSA